MDALHQSASRLGNIIHKTPNYVPLNLHDASDEEFFKSELRREAQNHVQTPPSQQQRVAGAAAGVLSKPIPAPVTPTSPPPVTVPAQPTCSSISDPHFDGSQMETNAHMVELHGRSTTASAASVQTMVEGAVKLVTMLNFMKVELGDRKTLRSKEQWQAAVAELIGTMLFVYLGCGSVVATGMLSLGMSPSRLVAIALAHGLAIAFLAGATGAISGGHLNPAVTLAFVIAGKETLLRAGLYVGAQLLGAVIGAALLKDATPKLWIGSLGSHDISNGVHPSQAFLMEIILTFVLIFVIFGVAVDRRGPGVIAPLPIGFAVLVDHLVGVPYTGASMNPARSFGPAVVSGAWSNNFWIYWFGPCFGATFASALYRYIFLEPIPVLPTTANSTSSTKPSVAIRS